MDEGAIAQYASGGAGITELQALADDAWKDALANSADRAEIEKLLSGGGADLMNQDKSPYAFEVDRSGITGVELLVGIAIAPYAKAFLIGLSAAAGKETASRIWNRFILPRIRKANPDAIGPAHRAK
jgi:hypothetical protein